MIWNVDVKRSEKKICKNGNEHVNDVGLEAQFEVELIISNFMVWN